MADTGAKGDDVESPASERPALGASARSAALKRAWNRAARARRDEEAPFCNRAASPIRCFANPHSCVS